MTIDLKDSNKTKLSLKVNKAVVDYIKEHKSNGTTRIIATNDLVNAVYGKLGISEIATPETKQQVIGCVKKCLTLFEEVKAIAPTSSTPNNVVEYMEYKKLGKQTKLVADKASAYSVSPEFSKKVSALKTNEMLLNCEYLALSVNDKTLDILIAKDLAYDKVKYCNSLFDYTKVADYIGCYNAYTNKVDFVATAGERRAFYCNNAKKHILPEKREIINLYYMVNMSKYKDLFMPSRQVNNASTLLSLRNDNNKILATDKLELRPEVYRAI